jgi:predicted nuclease with RNAse H fold
VKAWAGVDVGGSRRKRLHLAVLTDTGDISLDGGLDIAQAVDWLRSRGPALVAVDSPCETAAPGQTRRDDEAAFSRARICGLRPTPDLRAVRSNPYYEWIEHGLRLYSALDEAGLTSIECFPTASFTRWIGPRKARTRARWSEEALGRLPIDLPGHRLNQDHRDAIAAAVTAKQHEAGQTQSFGTLVVPRALPPA